MGIRKGRRWVFFPTGKAKFLGNILSTSQTDEDFAVYWNQVTPEDYGKLGFVEPSRGSMEWSALDAMYHYAKNHGFPFKEHALVWGRQQPEWIANLSPGQQRSEITKWISEFGERFPETEFIDVVNEPLHYPPPYKEALGGDGATGWDWVIWAYATARAYCPRAKLLLNDYCIPGKNEVGGVEKVSMDAARAKPGGWNRYPTSCV
jgi:endo-1,4-beta-xylanase